MNPSAARKWNCTGSYSLLQAAAWSFYAITLAFSSNVLYEYGVSDSGISLCLGLASALSAAVQLAMSEYVSRHPEIPVSRLLTVSGILIFGCSLVQMIPGIPLKLSIVAFCLICMALQLLPGFANALGMDTIKRGAPTHYSIARGMGSLGYSIAALQTGAWVRSFGVEAILLLGGVNAALLVIAAVWYHSAAERNLEPAETVTEQQPGPFLNKYPRFAGFLLGMLLLNISHGLLCNFMYQIMLAKSAGAMEQGVATSISAFVELPVMFGFPLLARKIRCDKWVRFAALAVAVKPLGILLSATAQGVYLAQATQMIGYGLLVISTVNYAERVVGKGESVRAQSYHGATTTVSSVAALSAGGVILEIWGAAILVAISLGFSLAGAVILLIITEKTE